MKIEKFVYLIIVCLISCSTQKNINSCNLYSSKEYIPVDLYDAIEFLNCQWREKDKQKFANLSEDDVLKKNHFGNGMGIRNDWELWRGENDLVNFFNSYRIFHPDDMSSIILTSFHRRLNSNDIDFEGQIQTYLDYWKPIQEFEKKEIKRVLEMYDRYKLGDLITIYMEIDTITHNASVSIGPDYEWNYNPENDLELKGKIIQKEIIQDSTDVKMLIQVIDMNKKETVKILGQSVEVGDITEMRLKYLKYE